MGPCIGRGDNTAETKASSSLPRRLRSCLSLLHANDEDTLWVSLSACHINDEHVGLICSALERNTHVLSLDLSANDISSAGFEALSACLVRGGGQDMIELDLRGNKQLREAEEGSGEPVSAALETLRRERRVLNVLVGAEGRETIEVIEVREVRSAVSTAALGEQTGVSSQTVASPAQNYSDFVQNIFQMANEEEDESDESDEGGCDEDVYLDMEEEHARLWGEVIEYVAETGRDARKPLAVLTNALWKLNEYLVTEFQGCSLPLLPDTTLDDLQTSLGATIAHIPILAGILELKDPSQAPAEDTCVTNATITAIAAITTTHRVLAATLAATALQANCPCVTKAFAENRIISLAIQNSLLRPSCSTIHAKALALTQIACSDECLLSRETEDAVEAPPSLWKDVVNAGSEHDRCLDTMVSIILDICGDDDEDRLPLKRGPSETGPNAYLLVGFCIAMCGMLFDLAYKPNERSESSDSDDVVFQASGSDDSAPGATEAKKDHGGKPPVPTKNPQESTRRDGIVVEIRAALEQNAAWNRLVESKVLETARAIQRQPLGGDVPEKLGMYPNDLGDYGAGPLMSLLQGQLGGMSLHRL